MNAAMISSDSPETRLRAARVVAAGGVVAFLTDTFYGLGADPLNAAALRKIKQLKGREAGKPILVVISDLTEADRFMARTPKLFKKVAERHWPGALTLVVEAHTRVPEELTAGSGTIGLRLPETEAVRSFTRACGGALTATSANLAGETPARSAQEVAAYFPDDLELVVDGGAARSDKASTVLDVSRERPRLIREGVVSRAELQATLERLGVRLDD